MEEWPGPDNRTEDSAGVELSISSSIPDSVDVGAVCSCLGPVAVGAPCKRVGD